MKTTARTITKRITVTAMLLGFAALCQYFSFNISLFGSSGMSIGFSGIFTAFPALLFGPVYGGMASAASDILGCLISPQGAYNPLFTIVAFAGGFIKGCIWRLFTTIDTARFRKILLCCFAVILLLGVTVYAFLASDGISFGIVASKEEMPSKEYIENSDISFVTSLITSRISAKTSAEKYGERLASYINYTAFCITFTGLFGVLTVVFEMLWSRYRKNRSASYGTRIFISIFSAEFFVTTVNTVILKTITNASAWSSFPFAIVYIPRLAEGLFICLVHSYFITILYTLLKKRNITDMIC